MIGIGIDRMRDLRGRGLHAQIRPQNGDAAAVDAIGRHIAGRVDDAGIGLARPALRSAETRSVSGKSIRTDAPDGTGGRSNVGGSK